MNIETLFAQTLHGEYDDDAPRKAVLTLQQIGYREVFDKAALWCHSQDVFRHFRGYEPVSCLPTGFDRIFRLPPPSPFPDVP